MLSVRKYTIVLIYVAETVGRGTKKYTATNAKPAVIIANFTHRLWSKQQTHTYTWSEKGFPGAMDAKMDETYWAI